MINMSAIEVASFTASLVSVALAVVAIWLSITFYRLSSQLSESTKESARNIGSIVERLEKLFDRLYADTFTMMKDTVSDMRHHIWPGDTAADEKVQEEAKKKADEQFLELRNRMEKDIRSILERQEITEDKLHSLIPEMKSLVERTISESRAVEHDKVTTTLRYDILRIIQEYNTKKVRVTTGEIIGQLVSRYSPFRVFTEIRDLKDDGVLKITGESSNYDSIVQLK